MPGSPIQFGEFSLDCDRYELLRSGRPVKMENIPMELLILLVSKRGNLVTRQEIVEHLWGADVFVETDHGINTAVRKVRQALRDDPEHPRFVQTVPGRGYRFVANSMPAETAPAAAPKGQRKPAAEDTGRATAAWRAWWAAAAVGIALLLGVGLLAFSNRSLRDRALLRPSPATHLRSIAMLPLLNLSGDPAQEYYAEGLTDETITMLAKSPGLRVVSRTSAMQYKEARRPLGEIARELGVDYILEGSVERSGDRMHMTVQLIEARTDSHLWAETYDRDITAALLLPGEVSQNVAQRLGVANTAARKRKPVNAEAHDAYLRGRYFWFNDDDGVRSQQYFEKAIQLQPDYAAAWSGLADSIAIRAVAGLAPSWEVMPRAEEAARKGVELDDSEADSHNTLGVLYMFYEWNWEKAEKEIRRAIDLDSRSSIAHHAYSYLLTVTQRPNEALQEQKRSTELDPFTRPWALGALYFRQRQYDNAIAELRLRASAQPHDAYTRFLLSQAYWMKSEWKHAEEELEEGFRLAGERRSAEAVRAAFAEGGGAGMQRWRIHSLRERAKTGYVSPWEMATLYASLHDRENTLRYLDDSYRQRAPWLIFIQDEPVLDFLHSDPRYLDLVAKMGLPAASRAPEIVKRDSSSARLQ